jgi:hypothetical protein
LIVVDTHGERVIVESLERQRVGTESATYAEQLDRDRGIWDMIHRLKYTKQATANVCGCSVRWVNHRLRVLREAREALASLAE